MAEKSYVDFDLQIEWSGNGYRAQVLDSPGGQAQAEVTVPFSDLELENFILRVGQRRRGRRRIESSDLDVARQFGAKLFQAIIREDIAGTYRSSLVWAQTHGMGLRIRLRLSGAPGLIDIPWEFLFDQSARRFVALSVDSPVVRFLDVPGVTTPLKVAPPIKILAVIASPSDFEPLQVEDEWKRLQAVADSVTALSIERLEKPTLSELQRALRREYHILHFVGHGGFDEATQDGLLVFEDEQGRGNEVSATYLATLLHDADSLRLAVLNACDGARGSRTDQFAGVAQSLLQQGVPAVVAMQFEISDDAALTFAREFYGAFAEGLPLEAALAEARKSMFAEQNDSEWATPVLYLRSVGSDIFEISQPAVETPPDPEAVTRIMEPVPIPVGRTPSEDPDATRTFEPPEAKPEPVAPHPEPEPEAAPESSGEPPNSAGGEPEPGGNWWRRVPRSGVAAGAASLGVLALLLVGLLLATRGGGDDDDDDSGATDTMTTIAGNDDFSGTWYTNFARLELEQDGTRVTGQYFRYLNGDLPLPLKGDVTGNNLSGTFAGDIDPFSFTMRDDKQSFDGYWSDRQGVDQQWCGSRDTNRLFDGCGYSGVWQVKGFPDAAANVGNALLLVQTENTVAAQFTSRQYGIVTFDTDFDGTVLARTKGTAELTGDNLPSLQITYEWTVKTPKWDAFVGTWEMPNSRTPGTWCAWRGDAQPPC
ncbi:MAG: CHAT domain-containing protein [Dehalococcoidia bacterium]